jgi:AcrR family transcriptional regulator
MIETTRTRIVTGATAALAAGGLRRFTMSEVCARADVSRGTLYRYFSDREHVLEAVRQHVADDLRHALDVAVRARPATDDRVRVVLTALAQHTARHPELRELLDREPALALSFLRDQLPDMVTAVAQALRPALQQNSAVASGLLSERQVAELLFRLMLTAELVPSRGSRSLAQRIGDLWESLLIAAPQEQQKRLAG